MSSDDRPVRRRTVLRGAVVAGLATGTLSTTAAAEHDCCVCWVDVKPDSCPNSINPNNGGVVSVAAGKPDFRDDTVELIPVSEACADDVGFDPAFDRCQDYQNAQWSRDCTALENLGDCSDDRSATPIRSTTEDINDDGTTDTVFKFETGDLDLREDDAYLLLRGTAGDCTTYGIDSVRVVDARNGRGSESGSRGRGGENRGGR